MDSQKPPVVVKVFNVAFWVLVSVAMLILVGMMLLTVVDVGGRYLINKPIVGSTEITEVMMLSLAFLALVWCTVKKVHIKLDLLTDHIPPAVRTINDTIFFILGMVVFSLISWQNFRMARDHLAAGHSSWVLHIPNYPFYFVVAITSGIVALVLLLFIIQNIVQGIKRWK